MTSKCIDQSDPRTADEKLEVATLRNAELTEKELENATGGRSCCAGGTLSNSNNYLPMTS